jgi:hypothetical protein
MENPFDSLIIKKDKNTNIELLLIDEPATRALSAMVR